MQTEPILFPLSAMVILSFAIGIRLLLLRIKATKTDGLNPNYFLLNRGGKPPSYLTQTEQHYQNLFELPVLFYLLILTLVVTGSADALQLCLAWCFVVIRILHAIIHIGTNRLVWRRNAFLCGVAVLLIAWLDLIGKLLMGVVG
ncbi:MAPEG family protein [Thiomicrorhabdus sp.]|uniref:MAPEG family protein n=1 Tax=Thiomicrorhabdus sp. TaxID=2039724 RepID=UPI0029C8EB94|nr:MAPEG family protein [Thiomicrorhabdus sp.]